MLYLPESLWQTLDQLFERRLLDMAFLPDHTDALDGLPFKGPTDDLSGEELDGLVSFRRRLQREISEKR